MAEIKQILFYGKNGVIRQQIEGKIKYPLIEIDTGLEVLAVDQLYLGPRRIDMGSVQFFTDAYKNWGRFGYLGDIIAIQQVSAENGFTYYLSYIGRLTQIKPGLAVDLIPVIRVFNEHYFVGVKRKYEPGIGRAALMGGFIDIHEYHMDTALETIVHEAADELGMKITVLDEDELESPISEEADVTVDFKGIGIPGKLIYLATCPTGKHEELRHIRQKRVYQTSVYILELEMTAMGIDEHDIRNWLQAGDDATELVIFNLKDYQKYPFGIDHHQVIFDLFIEGWKERTS